MLLDDDSEFLSKYLLHTSFRFLSLINPALRAVVCNVLFLVPEDVLSCSGVVSGVGLTTSGVSDVETDLGVAEPVEIRVSSFGPAA